MGLNRIIEKQKKNNMTHTIIYAIFVLGRIFFQLTSKDVEWSSTILMIAFLLICKCSDDILYHFDYFNKTVVVKIHRYLQCLVCTVLVYLCQLQNESLLGIVALLVVFMVDLFLCMEIADRSQVITYGLVVTGPVLLVIAFKMFVNPSEGWLLVFFDFLLLVVVLGAEAYSFVDYMVDVDNVLRNQRYEVEHVIEEKDSIMNMQDKMKSTNQQLNLQKIELQNANKQIKNANAEMVMQAELLRYISTSFDLPKISNHITESLMTVKNLSFCAVYIKEGVYLNKYANYVIKTKIAQLQSKMKDNLEDVYNQFVQSNKREITYHADEIKDALPFLKDVYVNSVYIKLLGQENEQFGIFMIGDCEKNMFQESMSFYDAVIAQYNIAIANARIYNDMQHMARKDGLTGINNRIYFNQLFKEHAEQIVAKGGCMSVALMDIDKFKSVNDTYGHLAGDEVIKRIATVTENCIDRYDGFVCRYGGEEFVAVLPGRNLEVATPIIEELFEEICKQVVHYNDNEIHMSVSVGLTSYPEVCDDTEQLLKRADWCMYYSKEHGRCQIKVDDGSIQRD